jgi:hypothetical protein
MAKLTVAYLQAQLAAAEADAAGARAELASLQHRVKHDYVERAEYSRVQGVLTSCQTWLKKYKGMAQRAEQAPVGVSFKDRCHAYMEATGKTSVNSRELREWESDNATA